MRKILGVLGVVGLSAVALAWKPQDDAAKPEFYTAKVQPIFEANCYKCHGGENHRGGLSLMTRDSILTGGHHGPAIILGDPAKSLLVTLIHGDGTLDDQPTPMPPSPRPKLTDEQIAIIEQWIKTGALMPAPAPNP